MIGSVITYVVTLLVTHPEVAAVLLFLLAVGAHVIVGALVHLVRIHDWDWAKLGQFVEADFATARGIAILVTFLGTLATTTVPGGDWRAAFVPAFIALAASCAAATLPVLRDTLYELIWLLSGTNPKPGVVPARAT